MRLNELAPSSVAHPNPRKPEAFVAEATLPPRHLAPLRVVSWRSASATNRLGRRSDRVRPTVASAADAPCLSFVAGQRTLAPSAGSRGELGGNLYAVAHCLWLSESLTPDTSALRLRPSCSLCLQAIPQPRLAFSGLRGLSGSAPSSASRRPQHVTLLPAHIGRCRHYIFCH